MTATTERYERAKIRFSNPDDLRAQDLGDDFRVIAIEECDRYPYRAYSEWEITFERKLP